MKELVLTGCIKQDSHYPLSQYCTQLSITDICDILKNAKPISKIQFAFIEILEKLSILGECGNGSFSLGKLTSEAKHITECHLRSVTSCQLSNFPSAIKLLDCLDADYVSLEKLKKSSIETLILKNCCCDTKRLEFSYLTTLELVGEIPGDDDEIVFCSTVKVLRLVNLYFYEKYLPLFSSESKILTLHNVAGVNDETLRLMIEGPVFLTKLICKFTGFTKHTISDGYMQSLVSTRQKLKVILNEVLINEEIWMKSKLLDE